MSTTEDQTKTQIEHDQNEEENEPHEKEEVKIDDHTTHHQTLNHHTAHHQTLNHHTAHHQTVHHQQVEIETPAQIHHQLLTLLQNHFDEIERQHTISRSIFFGEFATHHASEQFLSQEYQKTPTTNYLGFSPTDLSHIDALQPSSNTPSPPLDFSLPLYSNPSKSITSPIPDTLFGLKPSSVNLEMQAAISPPPSSEQSLSPIATPAHQDKMPSSTNHDFIIDQLLGEGGMGHVFQGLQTCLNREVAIKISKIESPDPRLLAQICHEAQITARLDHPNILPIYLLARSEDGKPIQVMKRIEGVSWHDLLYSSTHPLWIELNSQNDQETFHLEVLTQVSQAISYAHERGVIHRDLKPENVMIGKFGEVYVLDWGVALDLATAQGEESAFWAQQHSGLENALVGTPAYMPPEMAKKEIKQQGTWSDVYLLGAILYQILTKNRLHQGKDVEELYQSILQGKLPLLPNEMVKEMRDLIQASLAYHPEQRLPNAGSFRLLLIEAIRTLRSRSVEQRGWDALKAFQEELTNEDPEPRRLEVLFDESKHYFWTALEMWPMNPEASAGLDQILKLWGRHLISLNEFTHAKRILSELREDDPDLFAHIAFAKGERDQEEQEHQALKDWREDESLASSRRLRLFLAKLGFLSFGLGSLICDLLERSQKIHINAQRAFIFSVILSSFVALSFLLFSKKRRTKQQNALFSRLVHFLGVILCGVMINRFVGWQLGENFRHILLHEMCLIMVGCFGMSTISGRKDFTWGGGAFTLGIVLSVLWTKWLTLFYSLSMIILWIGVILSWRNEEPSPTSSYSSDRS